jgi:hypothetical protein
VAMIRPQKTYVRTKMICAGHRYETFKLQTFQGVGRNVRCPNAAQLLLCEEEVGQQSVGFNISGLNKKVAVSALACSGAALADPLMSLVRTPFRNGRRSHAENILARRFPTGCS